MRKSILADEVASISDLKRSPMDLMKDADRPVAILNHNRPAFYCVPPDVFEQMLEAMEDQLLGRIVDERQDGDVVKVSLDDL